MPAFLTDAIVLSTVRYSDSSKVVRLATREHGVVSAIAKGALRPRSRFGAALQLLSLGQAHLIPARQSELHTLAAFDLIHLPLGLADIMERYSSALALGEVMLRFSPAAPHPEAFHALHDAVAALEVAPVEEAAAIGLRWLWHLVGLLGFTPSVEVCVVDGAPVAPTGPMAFSAGDGGALCTACARSHAVAWLAEPDRQDLVALLSPDQALPVLDALHAAAHRRLLARYVHHQLGEGTDLVALDFWQRHPREPA